MKIKLLFILFISILLSVGCKKDGHITTDPSVKLEFSADSVLFDTVFTSVGSVTQRVKVFNRGSKAVRIQEIKLGATNSSYQINVNGVSAQRFTQVELRAKDSLSLFVKVTVDPGSAKTPFIVKDSVSFLTNGNYQKVVLLAYGQNAHFLNDELINENTVWDSTLPYVIYNSVKVNAGKTLTIKKGSRIYFHKDAELVVAGTLRVEGELKDSVVFASDRLERIYAEESGQWKGLHFLGSSKDNLINHSIIKNGLIGVQLDGLPENTSPKILLVNSVIKNMEVAALYSDGSAVSAYNNIFTNCSKYLLYCINGGKYDFKQNTFANFNFSFPRITPGLYFTDVSATNNNPSILNIELINNIIWGSLPDELIIERKGTLSNQIIGNNLIRTKSTNWGVANIFNTDPSFKNAKNYNFLLTPGSPAANKGADLSLDPQFSTWLNKDFKGATRLFPSDLGCYELL